MARPKATILELFSEFVSAVPQVGLQLTALSRGFDLQRRMQNWSGKPTY
jgi:hypothetical protein